MLVFICFHGCRTFFAQKVLLIPGPRRENLDGAVGPRADERPRVVKWLVFVDFFVFRCVCFFVLRGGGKPQTRNSVFLICT